MDPQKHDISKLSIEEKVGLILNTLRGDPLDDEDLGLLGNFRELREEFYKLKSWRDKTVAWAFGVSCVGGGVITYLITLLINALTHHK